MGFQSPRNSIVYDSFLATYFMISLYVLLNQWTWSVFCFSRLMLTIRFECCVCIGEAARGEREVSALLGWKYTQAISSYRRETAS